MRFTADSYHVRCKFDIPGYGSGEQILTVEQAKALRDQLDKSINYVEEA